MCYVDDNLQQDENASQTGEEMSTADAVSLFTTSLNSALAKQKQDILSELQPNRQSSTSTCKESSINSSCQHNKFELLNPLEFWKPGLFCLRPARTIAPLSSKHPRCCHPKDHLPRANITSSSLSKKVPKYNSILILRGLTAWRVFLR
jgi:hypothetical protein